MNICLIVDSKYISKWEYDAVHYAKSRSNLKIHSVLFCTNSFSKRRYLKHFLYFALNLIAMRNKWTKKIEWQTLISDKTCVQRFEANNEGSWQSFPVEICKWLENSPPDVVIKFGMNLLRDPQKLPSKYGVLSFHHGNPKKFRGRPAGFYELVSKEEEIGVIVQRLTNSLDGGDIISSGNFKLYKHSYKRTLENAYGSGRYLLLKALNSLEQPQPKDLLGGIYKLPTNLQVFVFVLNIVRSKLKRNAEVLFFRKKWSLSTANLTISDLMKGVEISQNSSTIYTPREYAFAADPFFLENGLIICEVVEKSKNLGKLATVSNGKFEIFNSPFLEKSKHVSFPFVLNIEGLRFLLPEMATHEQQLAFELNDYNQIIRSIPLIGLENEQLVDPIITTHDGVVWLFAGKQGSDLDCLFLWSAKSIFEPFIEHKLNPIVCSPKFARNAGGLITYKGSLYRPAQDCTSNYGDGISLMKIESLTPNSYQESLYKFIKFSSSFGPHTINFGESLCVFDSYNKVFDPFAWKTKVFP